MISSVHSGISALKAFEKKMGVVSDNVANAQSEEFKKSRAIFVEGTQKQVEVNIERIDTPGPIVDKYEDGEPVDVELSNVDLAEEIPHMVIAQRNFEANLRSVQSQEETLDSLFDILG